MMPIPMRVTMLMGMTVPMLCFFAIAIAPGIAIAIVGMPMIMMMVMLMRMVMSMAVRMRMTMAMPVRMFVLVVMMVMPAFALQHPIAAGAGDAAAGVGLKADLPAVEAELSQLGFQLLGVDAEGDHRAEVHIAADPGGALIIESAHGNREEGGNEARWLTRP